MQLDKGVIYWLSINCVNELNSQMVEPTFVIERAERVYARRSVVEFLQTNTFTVELSHLLAQLIFAIHESLRTYLPVSELDFERINALRNSRK